MPKRVIAFPRGAADLTNGEVRFTLQVSEGQLLDFVATLGIGEQIISNLSWICAQLKATEILRAVPMIQAVSLEVQPDPGPTSDVLVKIETPEGVPFYFVLSREVAASAAANLKIQSERDARSGSA